MKAALTRLRHGRAVGLLRYHLYRDVLLSWPKRHACNICRWQGRRFLTYDHPFVLCPQCGSRVRHRLLAAAISNQPAARSARLDGRVLHISPEYCLMQLLRPRARHYVRGDWATTDADLRMDMSRLPFADGVFDVVVNCDTLEHIQEDRAALAECRRVLAPGGIAILTVPQSDTEADTREDPEITGAEARTLHYGQADHVRNYGLDFADRLAAAGFDVATISAADFDAADVDRHVLRPPIPLRRPWGWDNRRIFFAKRTAPPSSGTPAAAPNATAPDTTPR